MGRLSKAWLWAIPQFVGFVVLLCWVDSASRPVIALFLAVFLMILSVSIFIYRWTLPQVLPASYYRPKAFVSATDLRAAVPQNSAPTCVPPVPVIDEPPSPPQPVTTVDPIPEMEQAETNLPPLTPPPAAPIAEMPLAPEPAVPGKSIPEPQHVETNLLPEQSPPAAAISEQPPTAEPATTDEPTAETEQSEKNLSSVQLTPTAPGVAMEAETGTTWKSSLPFEVAMPPEPPRAADPIPEMQQAQTNLAPEPPSPAALMEAEMRTAWKSSLSFAVTPALAPPVPAVPLPAEPASTPGPVGETENSETNQIPLPLLPAPKPTAARRPRAHANNHRPISKTRRVKRPTPARSHLPTRVKAAPPRPRQPASTTANPPNPKPRRRLKSRFLTQASRLKLNLRSKGIPSLKLSPQRGELVFPFSPIHGI